MRKYDLNINEKPLSITVRSFTTDRAELEINGTVYNVRIDDIVSEGEPLVYPPAGHVMRALDRATPAPAAAPSQAQSPDGVRGDGTGLIAPIPGQILEIFVKEGSSVSAGEPVLKMEAMKMENVISAHTSGIVGSIKVKVGDTVNQGQELVVIG